MTGAVYRWRTDHTVLGAPRHPGPGLTEEERAILLFEASWRQGGRRKPDAIHERFGFGSTTYATRLAAILDNPEAAAAYPALVERLRRSRRRGRTEVA